jgi:hypothetical protein
VTTQWLNRSDRYRDGGPQAPIQRFTIQYTISLHPSTFQLRTNIHWHDLTSCYPLSKPHRPGLWRALCSSNNGQQLDRSRYVLHLLTPNCLIIHVHYPQDQTALSGSMKKAVPIRQHSAAAQQQRVVPAHP